MLRNFHNTLRKMANTAEPNQTLSKKLIKAERLGKKVPVKVAASDVDIEDAIADCKPTLKSQFFSPLQTRQQRKNNNLQLAQKPAVSIKAEISSKPTTKKSISTKKEVVETQNTDSGKSAIASDTKNWEPVNWQEMLENIRIMRASAPAPVDSMGCDKCSDENADEKVQRFQTLVALMLSSQTKDETTFATMKKLKDQKVTPKSIAEMKTSELEELLYPVSFYKNKAKYLQNTSRILMEKYDSDIPNNIKELVALPGVGPKMAHICMSSAWNQVTGIGVDVHVHRISNRLHWMPKETKEPEQTRVALESWLPRDLWQDVNHLFVGFGQTVCTPLRPHCGDCLNRDICPSANLVTNNKKKSSGGATEGSTKRTPKKLAKLDDSH